MKLKCRKQNTAPYIFGVVVAITVWLYCGALNAQDLYIKEWLRSPGPVEEGSFTFSYDRPTQRVDEYSRFRIQGLDFVVAQGTNQSELATLKTATSAGVFGRAGSNYWIYTTAIGMLQEWSDKGGLEEVTNSIYRTVYSAPARFNELLRWGIAHIPIAEIEWDGLTLHGTNAAKAVAFAGECITNTFGQVSQINGVVSMWYQGNLLRHNWELLYSYADTDRMSFPTNIVADLLRGTERVRLYSYKNIKLIKPSSPMPTESFTAPEYLSGASPRFSLTLSNDSMVVKNSQGKVNVEKIADREKYNQVEWPLKAPAYLIGLAVLMIIVASFAFLITKARKE